MTTAKPPAAGNLVAGPGTLRLSLPSDTSFLHMVTNLARNAAAAAGLGESDAEKLALATDEAVTNVIEHAYHGATDRTIDIVVNLLQGGVEVHIIHDGDPIDERELPTQIDPSDSAKRGKRGGLGVFLMRRLVDRVDFRPTEDQRNECCLVKEKTIGKPDEREASRARIR